MKKVALLLTLIFLFSGITDAQMMYQPKTSNLSSISGFTVDDDIDYMKKLVSPVFEQKVEAQIKKELGDKSERDENLFDR